MTMKTHFHLLWIQGLSILVPTTLLQLIFPWWMVAIVPFVIGYLFKSPLSASFIISFITIFLLWSVSAYRADQNFDISMSALLAEILSLSSPSGMFFLTGLTGGIVGGLSGFLGSWTRQLSQK